MSGHWRLPKLHVFALLHAISQAKPAGHATALKLHVFAESHLI